MQSYALIADPDADAASLYAAAARDEGLTYVSVRDGALALAVLGKRGVPQLLVTEITLPGLPGCELIARVRGNPGGEGTAVIVVSADRALRERAAELRAELGIGAVLSKVASFESIRRVLTRLGVGYGGPGGRTRRPLSSPPSSLASAPSAPGSAVRVRAGAPAQPWGFRSRGRG
jgi:CheY-like chemotaxis protein